MTRDEIITRARAVVVDMLDCAPEAVEPETEFAADLGADSMDSIELTMEIEEAFDIEMSDADASEAHTFGLLVDTIERKLLVVHG